MKNIESQIVITGSLAYDHIMTFPDQFKQHILPENIHMLSVSFVVDTLNRNFGGTAGNIAYTMYLLGLHPTILGAGGKDFGPYASWLRDNQIPQDGIKIFDDTYTAQAFIVTDRDNSQINAFHPGSMNKSYHTPLKDLPVRPEVVIISANGVDAMKQLAEECIELDIPYWYDPGQAMGGIAHSDLKDAAMHASVLVLNEYELHFLLERTELTLEDLRDQIPTVIVTNGHKGSQIYNKSEEFKIPIAPATRVIDPTGCGDAYRAGFLFGLLHGKEVQVSAQIGALAATYVVEQQGTQNHFFTWEEFQKRYKEAFGQILKI